MYQKIVWVESCGLIGLLATYNYLHTRKVISVVRNVFICFVAFVRNWRQSVLKTRNVKQFWAIFDFQISSSY